MPLGVPLIWDTFLIWDMPLGVLQFLHHDNGLLLPRAAHVQMYTGGTMQLHC